MKTTRITHVKQITNLALKKKSVWHERMQRVIPAAIVQNMPLLLIVGWLRMGWLYNYKPNKK